MTSDIEHYLQTGIDTVPGWFWPLDASLFVALSALQQQSGIGGDLLEIGVFHGQSAILMGYLVAPGEHLSVCDLFVVPTDDSDYSREAHRFYTGTDTVPSLEAFQAQYLRFHSCLPDIRVCPSNQLDPDQIGRTIRFLHIDGSHCYDDVVTDIALASQLLIPGGLVVFDDILCPWTPGVQAAVWEAVATQDLIPLCISRNKLYATWEPGRLDLSGLHHDARFGVFSHRIGGHDLLELWPPDQPYTLFS